MVQSQMSSGGHELLENKRFEVTYEKIRDFTKKKNLEGNSSRIKGTYGQPRWWSNESTFYGT